MKVRVFLIGSTSVYEVAETLEYDGVRKVTLDGKDVSATLKLQRGCGDVGIPFIRVHHWEETNEDATT